MTSAVELGTGVRPVATTPHPRRLWLPVAGEGAALLAAPAVAFFALRVRPMALFDMVDPAIYTGYAQNGPDLMTRFGPGNYFWVRLGLILPARLSYLAFGAVPGFYVLRYVLTLLAVVPLFVLLRRTVSRAAAWVGVCVVLTSPVLFATLGSDYPDSVIFAYLSGAFALLLVPTRHRWTRLAAVTVAGILLTLCLHSQIVSAPAVGAVVAGYLVATVRRRTITSSARVVLGLGASAVVTTAVLAGVAELWFGYGNLWRATLDNYRRLQRPDQVRIWHSSDWHWVLTVPYLAVPFVVCALWLASLVIRRQRPVSPAELAAGTWLTVSVAAASVLQFGGTVWILEYHLFSSPLWPSVLITLTFAVLRLLTSAREDRPPTAATWVVVGLVVAVGLVASCVSLPVDWSRFRYVLLAAALLVAVFLTGLAISRVRLGVVVAAILVAGLTALTIVPTSKHAVPGGRVSSLPAGQYGQVLGHSSDREELDAYRAASRLPAIVGPATAPGQRPCFWSSDTVPLTASNMMAGTYQWRYLPGGMPRRAGVSTDVRDAVAMRPEPLVLLVTSAREATSFLGLFAENGVAYSVNRTVPVTAGSLTVQVWVVTLS